MDNQTRSIVEMAINNIHADQEYLLRMLEQLPKGYVVVSTDKDLIYCVTAQNEKAQITLQHDPYVFTGKSNAERVAKQFKARNGNGSIHLAAITVQNYIDFIWPILDDILALLCLIKAE